MGVDQDKLAVDLFELWEIGKVYLPRVANDYATAADRLHRTRRLDGQVFRLPGTNGQSDAGPSWERLRDKVQELCRDSSENLIASGEALIRIMNDYAEQDQNNAAKLALEERIKGYVDNEPPVPQPVAPVGAPSPDDPLSGGGVEPTTLDQDPDGMTEGAR